MPSIFGGLKSAIPSFFRRNIFIVGLLIILIGALYLSGNLPFSFVPQGITMNYYEQTGELKQVWGADLYVFSNSGAQLYYLKPADAEGKVFKNYTPITLTITPHSYSCIYNKGRKVDTLETTFLYIFGNEVYYVESPQRNFVVDVKGESGNTPIQTQLDLADIASIQTLTFPDADGKGTLYLKAYGTNLGSSDCPDFSSSVVLYKFNGKYHLADRKEFVEKGSLYEDFSCMLSPLCTPLGPCIFICDQLKSWLENPPPPPATSNIQIINITGDGKVISSLNTKVSGHLSIYADADFLDAIFVNVPAQADPRILEIQTTTIKEGEYGSAGLRVKNYGASGTVNLKVETDGKTTAYYQTSTNINSGQEYLWSIKIMGGDVPANLNEQISKIKFTVCSEDYSKCDSRTADFKVVQSGLIPPSIPEETCGNHFCNSLAGENQNTCPQDCGTASKECPDYSYRDASGQCFCIEGYKFNAVGKCVPYELTDNIVDILAKFGLPITAAGCCLPVGGIGVLILAYFLIGNKKIRRR